LSLLEGVPPTGKLDYIVSPDLDVQTPPAPSDLPSAHCPSLAPITFEVATAPSAPTCRAEDHVVDEDTAYAVPGLSNMPPLAPGTSSNTDPPTNTDAGNGTLEAGEEDPRTLFINSLLLPLQENLTRTPSRGSLGTAQLDPPSQSHKAAFRDPNPEKQAKGVLVNKWEHRPDDAVTGTPDDTFAEHISSSMREAMRVLLSPPA
jgi:hypothetical protein